MPVTQDRKLNPQVQAEATEWLIRFTEDEVGYAEREAFSAWLKRSPERVDAYLHLMAFWREAGRPPAGENPVDIDQLVALAQREANVFPLALGGHEAVSPSPQVSHRNRWGVAAALVLVLALAAVMAYWTQTRHIYTTNIGEQRTVNLDDGSTVTINAKSSIRVSYDEHQRVIDLLDGQALFKVAADSARPFIVTAGTSTIRALGTQFDVYRKMSDTVVTVVEGRVSVTPQKTGVATVLTAAELLGAGEQAIVTPKATQISRPAHMEAVTAWTTGLLVFDKTPLREVVVEFNRQNVRPLVIDDDTLQDVAISAIFPASGSDRIVKFLEDRLGVSVTEDRDGIHISRSAATP